MRTLIVGIPLPHFSYDNYSFVSAPSFTDYRRMVVDVEGISRTIREVVTGTREHRTFAGHPVVNGPTSPDAFGLAEILAMRRREAEWLLKQPESLIVCFAHPDVPHPGIHGAEDWRRYSWLPAPEGFAYQSDLLPSFGKPGVEIAKSDHPFARFAEVFGARLAYRVHINEENAAFGRHGVVLLRSEGGAAVAAELRVGQGHVILLPPLIKAESERQAVALILYDCLESWYAAAAEGPQWLKREAN
jgi:hypothetical protein